MTLNAFADNGTIVARDGSPATGQVGIDLNASGDNSNFGASPFYTINDLGDGDSGANGLLNFPVLDTAIVAGGNLTLTGWARPGSVIELYIANPDGSGFGEGETYLVTLTEGSGADTDAGSGTYGSGPINGLSQGTDNTNRFGFTIPTPAGVVDGSMLSATATLGSNTSEFSGNVTVTAGLEIYKRAFLPDGTPIASGTTMPQGVEFVFMLYINNLYGAVSDVSIRDILDPLFAFQPGTIRVDNSVAACALQACTPAEEAAIFVSASAALPLSDAVDADTASYSPSTVEVGDQNVANARLDIAANSVFAVVFAAKVQ